MTTVRSVWVVYRTTPNGNMETAQFYAAFDTKEAAEESAQSLNEFLGRDVWPEVQVARVPLFFTGGTNA